MIWKILLILYSMYSMDVTGLMLYELAHRPESFTERFEYLIIVVGSYTVMAIRYYIEYLM